MTSWFNKSKKRKRVHFFYDLPCNNALDGHSGSSIQQCLFFKKIIEIPANKKPPVFLKI